MVGLLSFLLASLYLMQLLLFVAAAKGSQVLLIAAMVVLVFGIAGAVANIVYAVIRTPKLLSERQYRKTVSLQVLVFKLLAIPFFFINFGIASFFTSLFIIMPGGIFILGLVIPLCVGLAFLVMLATSIYSIMLVGALKAEGSIDMRKCVLYIICQLLFVVDIINQFFVVRLVRRSLDTSYSA